MKDLLKGIKIGFIVAFILLLFYVSTTNYFSWTYVWITVMFSVAISFSVSSFIQLVDKLRIKFRLKNFYLIWGSYYLASLVGMTIASEVCFYILNVFIKKESYRLFSEPNQLLTNLIIALVVTTIVGIYQSQRTALEVKLKQKEIDIIKLNQLKTQAELQTLQSRINPHFLYNSLKI